VTPGQHCDAGVRRFRRVQGPRSASDDENTVQDRLQAPQTLQAVATALGRLGTMDRTAGPLKPTWAWLAPFMGLIEIQAKKIPAKAISRIGNHGFAVVK
jgi:hypothetical protein